MASWFVIRDPVEARTILSPTSGFIAEAGFTHSLTPARNCTYGCVYCYVPTMRVQAGLKAEDWRRWGQFTTFKGNAAELIGARRGGGEVVYCSPLVDPYQPAEREVGAMRGILEALARKPPKVLAIQTRSPLVARDLDLLARLGRVARVSFSLTTDREDVRRRYEPHCEPLAARVEAMGELRRAGVRVFATLAPVLPCDPERLAEAALEASGEPVLCDPLHTRAVKKQGATTRAESLRVSGKHGWSEWHEPEFQAGVVDRLRRRVEAAGRKFAVGPEAFRWLAQ